MAGACAAAAGGGSDERLDPRREGEPVPGGGRHAASLRRGRGGPRHGPAALRGRLPPRPHGPDRRRAGDRPPLGHRLGDAAPHRPRLLAGLRDGAVQRHGLLAPPGGVVRGVGDDEPLARRLHRDVPLRARGPRLGRPRRHREGAPADRLVRDRPAAGERRLLRPAGGEAHDAPDLARARLRRRPGAGGHRAGLRRRSAKAGRRRAGRRPTSCRRRGRSSSTAAAPR